MTPSPSESPAPLGLRERKKARTRAAIRSEAIRRFAAHGFGATTVEQIAEAADVSPSTVFRYFPTKEAMVVTDEYDDPMLEAFRDQPPEVPPVAAFRAAVVGAMRDLDDDARQEQVARHRLIRAEPALRAAMIDAMAVGIAAVAAVLAQRTGRAADDPGCRALAGALVGVAMSTTIVFPPATDSPTAFADVVEQVDAAYAMLEQLSF
jgi:AcrR family transcriptional regulator